MDQLDFPCLQRPATKAVCVGIWMTGFQSLLAFILMMKDDEEEEGEEDDAFAHICLPMVQGNC